MMQLCKRTLKVAIKSLNMLILTKSTWKQKFLSTVMEIFFHYHFLYAEKNGHYAGIVLDAPTIE